MPKPPTVTRRTKLAESSKAKPLFGKREIGNLIRATNKGDKKFVVTMLRRGVDSNVLYEGSGSRPLTAAVRGGHLQIVRLLLDAGADPNLQDTWVSMPPRGTPLENAAEQGHLDIVKLLLERGADINKKGYFTPLRHALSAHQNEVVRFLLASGAKIERGDIIQAVWRGNEEGARQLIAAGAEVNVCSKYGESPLHFAAQSANPKLVTLLIAAGANLNLQTDPKMDGAQTPLHKAAFFGRIECVRLLLEAGADPLITDRVGKTPEGYAKRMRHRAVATVLRKWVSENPVRRRVAKKS